MPARAIALAPGVWRMPTFGRDLINSFAFEDADGSFTLVDAGLRGATRRLVAALTSIGTTPEKVTLILATHAHTDHIGDARRLRARTGGALHIHEHDATYARTGKPPPHDPEVPLARILGFLQRRQPSTEVDGTYGDDDVLPVAGGLRVLHTPGHTPGHCSFLHEPSGVLVTGDSLVNFRSRVKYSFASSCTNFKMCKDTADRLGEAEYEVAAFTHGPEIRTDARAAVRRFLQERLREG
jgi:glyoxylase-like metal-dependent hydrolase (beta-lactamase superfamily II)